MDENVGAACIPFMFGFICEAVFGSIVNNTSSPLSTLLILAMALFTMAIATAASLALYFNKWKVAVHSAPLGSVCAFGLFTVGHSLGPVAIKPFGWYLTVFATFHFSEYIITAMYSPRTLKLDSFLLNHSTAYWIAAVASWTEFFVQVYFIPGLKSYTFVSGLGLLGCFIGETLRKGAMITAGTNFTHLVSYRKEREHQLITHGVFSIFRHPAYVGWFWWSIATQMILCNPVCSMAYAIVSWNFFKQRIEDEELLLINFFGSEYVEYQKQVPTGLPLIQGYKPRY